MALPTSGSLSIEDIAVEFQSIVPHTHPDSLSEYYGVASGIPVSPNAISIGDFYGASANQFAALIGPNDIGDWYLQGYGNQVSGTTIVGNEGNLTFNCTNKTNVNGIVGFRGGPFINSLTSIMQNTGLSNTTHPEFTLIEVRVYGSGVNTANYQHDRAGLASGSTSTTNNFNWMYAYPYNTTSVRRGTVNGQSWSDKGNIPKVSGSGRTTVSMFTTNKNTNFGESYYQNNGGAIATALTATRTTSAGNWYIGAGVSTSGADPVIVGVLFVNRIVTTAEMQAVGAWIYNDSTVNIHTGNR